jgi:hypothetical protein
VRTLGTLRGAARLFVVVAIAALIVVGHGCHGDDVDHEPAARAPADDPR